MKRFLIIAAVGLALAGCAKDKISPAESVLLSCDAYASALKSLAPLRAADKLSAGTVKIVDDTRAIVEPICTGNAPDVDASVKDTAIKSGTALLVSIAAQFVTQ